MGPVLALRSTAVLPAGRWCWPACRSACSWGRCCGSRIRVGRPMLFGMLISLTLPVWLVCLAFALPLPVVAAGAFAWGLAIELFMVFWITALQTNVPRESLSRVMAYDAMGSLMFGPIGLALAGPAGRRGGAAGGVPHRGGGRTGRDPGLAAVARRCATCAPRRPGNRRPLRLTVTPGVGFWKDGNAYIRPLAAGVTDAHRIPRGLRRDARPSQGRQVRLPGDQLHLVPDHRRRHPRLRRGRERRHRAVLLGRRGVRVRPGREEHGRRRRRPRRVRALHRRALRRQHRPAHRPLPQGQAARLHGAAAQGLAGARGQGPRAAVPVAHVGRLRGAAEGEHGDLAAHARGVRQGAHDPRDRDRRRRRRGGRHRGVA